MKEGQVVSEPDGLVTDRVSREGKAIGRVRLSVRLSVRPSVLCLHRLIFELEFFCVGHDHSSHGIVSQGHMSRTKVNVQGV